MRRMGSQEERCAGSVWRRSSPPLCSPPRPSPPLPCPFCGCMSLLGPRFCPSAVVQCVLLAVVTVSSWPPFLTHRLSFSTGGLSGSSRQGQAPTWIQSLLPDLGLWSWTPPCLLLARSSEPCTELEGLKSSGRLSLVEDISSLKPHLHHVASRSQPSFLGDSSHVQSGGLKTSLHKGIRSPHPHSAQGHLLWSALQLCPVWYHMLVAPFVNPLGNSLRAGTITLPLLCVSLSTVSTQR